ncbi:hypothetical protein QYE76_063929 [Lolium multiflorum]|uniref:KIB1-4 beta-propeller domain-containing protein n=1 Tax=Lolium multiflorum TaxID=4521 RepID=A0AAD8S5V9_LOLMU|nr:hypothetical protein QYE76_063929 [Lolium multiflorum]
MGTCLGKTAGGASSASPPPCWTDLPRDIAGLVLARFGSDDDRLAFAATCREWRLVAQLHPTLLPPALPFINLGDGAYRSIADGKVHRFAMPVHSSADDSFGNILLGQHHGSGQCFIYDPFSPSMPAIDVPCRYKYSFLKSTFLDQLSPSTGQGDHVIWNPVKKIIILSPRLVVAMFKYYCCSSMAAPINLAYFGGGSLRWLQPDTAEFYNHGIADFKYVDIDSYHGKIFAVGWTGHLFAHDLVVGETMSLSCGEHVIKEGPDEHANYHLVISADKKKLLLVCWSIPQLMTRSKINHHSMSLRVFEADLDKGRWSKVKNLGNQVLFVGASGSRAYTVACQSENHRRRFRGGNRVFLLGNDYARERKCASVPPCKCSDCERLTDGIPTYCVFDMTSRKASLVSLTSGHDSVEHSRSDWFFSLV